jgi:hypothetical protein
MVDDFHTHCEYCGEQYENYMRTFKFEGKTICQKCVRDKLNGKNWYVNHVPNFVDGADLKYRVFDEAADFLLFLDERGKEDDEEFQLSDNTLMVFSEKRNWWWVVGFINANPSFIDELGLKTFVCPLKTTPKTGLLQKAKGENNG